MTKNEVLKQLQIAVDLFDDAIEAWLAERDEYKAENAVLRKDLADAKAALITSEAAASEVARLQLVLPKEEPHEASSIPVSGRKPR